MVNLTEDLGKMTSSMDKEPAALRMVAAMREIGIMVNDTVLGKSIVPMVPSNTRGIGKMVALPATELTLIQTDAKCIKESSPIIDTTAMGLSLIHI